MAAQPGAAVLPTAHSDDRFEKGLQDLGKTIAFGATPQKVITMKSGGQSDQYKQIRFSMRREFFTMHQYLVGLYWASIMGLFAGTLLMSLLVPSARWDVANTETGPMNIGIALLSGGIAAMLSETQTFAGLKHCTDEKMTRYSKLSNTKEQQPIVSAEYQGQPCFTDWDCTRGAHLKPGQRGMCRHSKSAVSSGNRRVLTPLIVVAGIVMVSVTMSGTEKRPGPKDLAQSIIYGIFGGTALSIIFS